MTVTVTRHFANVARVLRHVVVIATQRMSHRMEYTSRCWKKNVEREKNHFYRFLERLIKGEAPLLSDNGEEWKWIELFWRHRNSWLQSSLSRVKSLWKSRASISSLSTMSAIEILTWKEYIYVCRDSRTVVSQLYVESELEDEEWTQIKHYSFT